MTAWGGSTISHRQQKQEQEYYFVPLSSSWYSSEDSSSDKENDATTTTATTTVEGRRYHDLLQVMQSNDGSRGSGGSAPSITSGAASPPRKMIKTPSKVKRLLRSGSRSARRKERAAAAAASAAIAGEPDEEDLLDRFTELCDIDPSWTYSRGASGGTGAGAGGGEGSVIGGTASSAGTGASEEDAATTNSSFGMASVGSYSTASSGNAVIRMDKYGFIIGDNHQDDDDGDGGSCNSGGDVRHRNGYSKPGVRIQSRALSRQWETILENAPNLFDEKAPTSQLKAYTRRGLPDALRRKAWTTLTGVDVIMNASPGEYDALVAKADWCEEEYRWLKNEEQERGAGGDGTTGVDDDVCDDGKKRSKLSRLGTAFGIIERDINRTFPTHYLFGSSARSLDHEDAKPRDCHGERGSARDPYSLNRDDSPSDDDDDGSSSEAGSSIAAANEMELLMLQSQWGNNGCHPDCRDGGDSSAGVMVAGSMIEETRSQHTRETHATAAETLSTMSNSTGLNDSDARLLNGSAPQPSSPRQGGGAGGGMGNGQGALRRVLRAYSVYDTSVGYCQGMNFIAAMMLTFLSEEESFWLLVIVMNEEPYKLRDLFSEDMSGTREVLYIAEKLVGQFLPKLMRHMNHEGVQLSMFTTQWLITVFTSTFPFDLVVRVWDSFLVEGWKVIYRTLLSLLNKASKDVLDRSMPFEEILAYMKEFPSTVNPQAVMTGSLRIGLKKKHIQKHMRAGMAPAGERDS